jgi:fused signal recognition particle receptor
MGLFDQIKNGLEKTARQLSSGLGQILHSSQPISRETLALLEEQLILCDTGVETAQAIVKELSEKAAALPASSIPVGKQLLKEVVEHRLVFQNPPWELARPVIILLGGVNGAGKTTTAGKLAARYTKEGRKVLLVAGDTFRAAAEEQLTQWSDRAKVEVVRGAHGASPSSVIFDALKSGLSRGKDCLIVDTAGRLHNRSNLMEELDKIARVIQKAVPGISEERWLVLDANTGQNAIHQAREFNQGMTLTGLVLTKLDGTAKGGVVLALADRLSLPIRFLGVGEGLEDLVPFDARLFAEALLSEDALA